MFVVKQETGGFQDKIARCDVLREVSRRGCPCPIAGRSPRPSLASAHCMPAALRHPACPCRQARLPGHGQPLIHSAARRPARQDAGRSTSERMLAKTKIAGCDVLREAAADARQAKIAGCDVLREAAADARQAKIAGCDVLREAAADARQDKMARRAMFVVKQETGGFQAKIAGCDVLRAAVRAANRQSAPAAPARTAGSRSIGTAPGRRDPGAGWAGRPGGRCSRAARGRRCRP